MNHAEWVQEFHQVVKLAGSKDRAARLIPRYQPSISVVSLDSTRSPIMTDPSTFTAEHRAWEWELVMQYEDGSLPASQWSAETLTVIAAWYAKNLSREQATARYEQYFHRNRHRLTHRRDNAAVATEAIEAVDAVWESLLARALEKKA